MPLRTLQLVWWGVWAAWMAAAPVAWAQGGAVGVERPRADSAMSQLEVLLELAPSRQAGQPGNEAVDRLIREQFEAAVERQNRRIDPGGWQQAQALWGEAQRAHDELLRAELALQLGTTDTGLVRSPLWVRYTVEEPWTAVAVLAALVALMLVTWYYQQRPVLLAAAAVSAALAVVLPIAAWLVVTEAERPREGVQTTASLQRAVAEASRAALETDLGAAQALRGYWQAGRMTYPTAVFLPGPAELRVGEGPPIRLFQMTSNLVEPANLPAQGFDGPLVYVGSATPDELAGKDVSGATVLIDFNSAKRWLNVVQLGAQVVLVIEPPAGEDATFAEAVQKVTETPLSVPRFYVRRADVAAGLGEAWPQVLAGAPAAALRQEPGRWEARQVAADWLFIPGRSELASWGTPLESDPARQLVHVQTFKDAMSVVPELSPGAESAGNLVALLALLRQFEASPPQRPVLLSVVNEHTNALLGEQEYAFAAFADPLAAEQELAWTATAMAQQVYIAQRYHLADRADEEVAAMLVPWRNESQDVAGQNLRIKDPVVKRLQTIRNHEREERNRIVFLLEEDNRRSNLTDPERAQLEARRDEIDRHADSLVELQQVFNRFGVLVKFDELSPEQQQNLRDHFAAIEAESRLRARRYAEVRDQMLENLSIRRRLAFLSGPVPEPAAIAAAEHFRRRHRPLPAILGLTLDLHFGADRAGFFYLGQVKQPEANAEVEANTRVGLAARLAQRLSEDYAREARLPNRLENTILMARGVPWQAHLGGKFAMGSAAMHQYKVPALTLTSVRDMRPRTFTPHDTAQRIDPRNFEALMAFFVGEAERPGYLVRLVNADLGATRKDAGQSMALSAEISVRRQDQFAVSVPEQPIDGSLVLAYATYATATAAVQPMPNVGAMFGQVRPWPILMTDERGIATLRGAVYRNASVLTFSYDPDFRQMRTAVDFGSEKRFTSLVTATVSQLFVPRIVVAAEFEKTDLIGLTRPLTLEPVTEVDVIDARQDSLPRHFATAGVTSAGVAKGVPLARDGTGSVFIEPGFAFKLKVGAAIVINTEEEDEVQAGLGKGAGFPSGSGRLGNVQRISASDMHKLTSKRIGVLNDRGVKVPTAEAYNERAEELIREVDEAAAAGDNRQLMVAADKASGYAYQAYIRGVGTINDLIKAVVIFLALVIPFCFFVTKLVSPFTDINRQLAMFGAIFAVMALLLYFLHPAFKIAATPAVVILAFVILGLAGFVALVLTGRFNASMTQVVEESQQAESVDAPQSRLAGVAFMVGVNNMKRRRIRTTLTCATIVLVTFTMLSVISVGQDIEPTVVRGSPEVPYTGFLFARPGLSPIDAVQLQRLRAQFEDRAEVVVRAWAQRLGTSGEYLGYQVRPAQRIAGATVPELVTKVLVGMEVAEDGLTGELPIVAGRWISSNDAPEIVLSVRAAGLLGIGVQGFAPRELIIAGRSLRLVGLLDDERLAAMHDLADVPLLPMLSPPSQTVQFKVDAPVTGQERIDAAGALAGGPGVEPARPVDVAFVPIGVARALGEADYRTISVKYRAPADDAEALTAAANAAWHDAREFIQYQFARLTVGIDRPVEPEGSRHTIAAGQYTLASSSSTEVGGVLKVAIPIILAATIILNTMLGSVMERRREVAIYNSIGLNPGHVMMFFLAESFVFGLVGSVAGYLIGQGLALVVAKFDLPLALNYSSLSVMVVIFLTIAVVLLSTVYPAVMAARAAVPSGQRKWSLPQPEGDQIHVQFPFSYDADRVLGVCAYLRDFMRQNSEASTGRFLARLGPVGRVPANGAAPAAGDGAGGGDAQRRAYAMLFDIAPAPFDLGVNQTMEVYAYYDPKVRAHMLAVHLTRISGETGNWVTVNQPFLEALRKRLLGWRSQKPETHQVFYRQGQQLFAQAPDLPVVAPATERGVGSTQEQA